MTDDTKGSSSVPLPVFLLLFFREFGKGMYRTGEETREKFGMVYAATTSSCDRYRPRDKRCITGIK